RARVVTSGRGSSGGGFCSWRRRKSAACAAQTKWPSTTAAHAWQIGVPQTRQRATAAASGWFSHVTTGETGIGFAYSLAVADAKAVASLSVIVGIDLYNICIVKLPDLIPVGTETVRVSPGLRRVSAPPVCVWSAKSSCLL